MRYLSVFSGIEAVTVAWSSLGWKVVGLSETDTHACRVLSYRFPAVTNYGDAKEFKTWDIKPGSIDVIVGGPPCQSWSIAGLRRGLDDERGRLVLVFLEMVEVFRPTWFAFENVPNIVSSDGGRALGYFLGKITDLGYGWAYRCLDASGWGVPQKRKRFFLVGHSSGDFRNPAQVLFESRSMHGNFEEGEGKTISTAESTGTSTDIGGWKGILWDGSDKSRALTRHGSDGDQRMPDKSNFNAVLQPMSFSWQSRGDMRGQELSTTARLWLQQVPAVLTPKDMIVRRFTPLECERLMGFPDGFTDVRWYQCCEKNFLWHKGERGCEKCKGKKIAKVMSSTDKKRYELLGNSMVVPQMKWIGERIQLVHDRLMNYAHP